MTLKFCVGEQCSSDISVYRETTQLCVLGHWRVGGNRLNTFHMRCLRNGVKIKWQDRIPDTEVLKRAGTQSLYPILRSQVAWTRCAYG